jgi:phosphoglycerol transferase MdoB-like AlkP superfamily enzyme
MRYRLRTLMILLAILPPVLAGYYFLVTRDMMTILGLILSFPLAIVSASLIFVLPLLGLDWLLKRVRRP